MQEVQESPFLATWHTAMYVGAIIFFTVGVVFYLVYTMRVSAIKNYHDKYDFINLNEIKWYKYVVYSFGLAVAMLVNTYAAGKVAEVGVWFFARIFISIAGAAMVGYISALVLEYWYPAKLNVKLKKLRYMPRINPKTGNKMRLLSESEEDVHLDEGMQAEEGVFSVDYDVWLDEATNDVHIEKYEGRLQAQRCGNCGFYTMRVVREEVSETHANGTAKELVKHFQCSYCKSVRATAFQVSTKESTDYQKFTKAGGEIELVRIEIHAGTNGKKFFEFQTIEQAQKFLSEYDFNKVA